MMTSVQGIYRDGRVDLTEQPLDIGNETRVIVTFLGSSSGISLRDLGMDEAEAADLRARLATFASEWDRPEMDVYDEYDAARARM